MIPQEILQTLQCGLSTDDHIISNPIALSCGHSACKDCIPLRDDSELNKCKLCGKVNQADSSVMNESQPVKQLMKIYLSDLFHMIEERYQESISNLKNCLSNMKAVYDRFNLQIEYVKEEIQLRVESLKIELDKINDDLQKQLDESKENHILSQIDKIDVKSFEKELEEFKEIRRENIKLTENSLYEYQSKLKEINIMIDDLENCNNQVSLKISTETIDLNLIGSINFECNNTEKTNNKLIKNKLKNGAKVIVNTITGSDVYDMCVLPNNHLLVSFVTYLSLYNENTQFIRRIDRINGQTFRSGGITSNIEDKVIYISDDEFMHRIIMTDLELNFIKSIGDKYGNGPNQFAHPGGICYFNDYIYVCDYNNFRIQKLTKDLDFVASYQIPIEALQIKIINNVACIRCNRGTLSFYHLKTFKKKFHFDKKNGPICVINSYFYNFSIDSQLSAEKKVICFDKNGNLDEIIESYYLLKDIQFDENSCAVYFNNQILIATGTSVFKILN